MQSNEKLERFLDEEYYYLHKIGLVYSCWDTKGWIIVSSLQFIIYYTLLALFLIDFYYTAYLSMGDIAMFSQNIHLGIVCLVAFTITINCAYFRSSLIDIYSYLMEDMCSYQSGEFYEGLKRAMIKEKKLLLLFWPLYYGSCAVVAIIGPMLDKYLGTEPGQAPHPQISYRLPIAVWMPFNVDEGFILFTFVCFFLTLAAFIVALVVAAGVVGCVVVMQHLCLHLQLLIHSLETIDKRTEELYMQKEEILSFRNIDHQIYMKYYYECLKENIKHHQLILSIYKKYEKVVNLPIFVPFIAGAILLAMAGVHVLSDDPRIGSKLTSATLVTGEVLNMLMLCVYGEKMKQLVNYYFVPFNKGEDLRFKAYSLKWYKRGKLCNTAVSIMQERTRVPMNIRCLYILEINMETFAKVINSAYSYFNLVYAFK